MRTRFLSLCAALALLWCVTGAWAQSGDAAPAQTKGIDPALLARAQEGDAAAEFQVGMDYYQGRGVPPDLAQAALWYRKAAEQGSDDAQLQLGFLYESGRGVPQDYTQAAFWYRKAAVQGNSGGQNSLGILYENGKGVDRDYAQAAFWFRKAAEQGASDAQMNLSYLYADGQGVPQDYQEAYFWMNIGLAVSNMDEPLYKDAVKYRDSLASHLTPADLSRVQERAREWFEAHPAKSQ